MDTLFECRYIRKTAMYREFYHYWFFKRPIMVFVYVLLGFGFLCGVVDFVLYFNVSMPLFIVPFCVCMMYFSYLSVLHNAQKRDLEICGGNEPEVHITISQDTLSCNVSSGASVQLPMSRLVKAVQLKNQIVLISDAKLLYAIPENSYLLGNTTQLKLFLKQKGLLR